jgi:hypothetical protein
VARGLPGGGYRPQDDLLEGIEFPVPLLRCETGDVDGDGDVDLAVARSERRISLLANTGGAFAAPQSFTLLAGSGSDAYRQIALSDVDRDGDLDMLYASNTLNGTTGPVVGLYRNAGGGTFGAVEQIALDAFSSSPTDMAVADVTGDGWPDLLVAEHLAWTFVRGNGSGGFTAPQSRIGGQGPIAIGAADMDADGDVEPVITNRDSLELTVHWNEGQGQLLVPPSYPAGSLGNAIAHGDVDQDGDLDVAVSYGYTGAGGVLILRNQGNGSFAPAVSYTGGAAIRVKLRDMNGDGKLDLLYADGGPPYDFHVRLNLGAGAFGAASTVPIHTCGNGDIEAFDADHDGDLDVFVTEYLGCPSVSINRCFISRNQGDGTFLPHQILTTYLKCEIIGFGRLDGDLHDDLILTSANGVEVYRGNGDATFQPPVLYDTDWGPKHMVVADLSGDGELDVASYNFGDTVTGTGGESMSILIGNGNGSFQPRVTYHASYSPDLGNPEGIEAVDFDGDSDLDILGGNYGSNDFSVYENLGNGTYRPQARYGTGMRTLDIAAADFDGDGRVDVVGVVGLPPSGLSTAIVFVRGRQNATPATSFCAGDAQTGGCPCGTSTVAGHGCPNSAAASGGRLATSGFADLSADTLRLTCTDVPNGPALYFQGTDAQNGGAGFAFGDGKLCAGGLIVRLGIAFAASNTSSWPDADPAHRISVVGLAAAGDLRHYQAWYRDADPGFCTSATFNTTNGVSLTWTP